MKRFLVSFLILSFFIWIGRVLSLYFKVHYSYLALFLSKNNILDELYFLCLLALLSYASGRRILILCRLKFYSLSEEFIFATGIGWVILVYGQMILGIYTPYVTMALLLFFIIELFIIVRIGLNKIRFVLEVKFTPLNLSLWFLLGITVFLTFLMALTPSFFERKESLYLSSIIELVWGNEILAKLIHFYFGILIIIGIFALVNRHFNPAAGILSSCIFYISSVVIFLSGRTGIELMTTFYELLVIYSLLCWLSSYKILWFVMMIIQICLTLATNDSKTYSQVGIDLFSPIYLLSLPIFIFMIKEKLTAKYLFIYIVIQLFIRCCVKIDLLPLLPLLAILISHLIYTHLKEYTLLRRVVLGVIIGIFILILTYESYVIFNYWQPLKFIFGLETSSEYVVRISRVLR